MRPGLGGVLSHRSSVQLAALLKVQAKLSLREPYGLGLGVGFPAVLLVALIRTVNAARRRIRLRLAT